MKSPEIKEVLEDTVRNRGLRADLFARAALSDADLKLPALSAELPVEAILEFRADHADDLGQVRAHLAAMARRIESEPWTDDFAATSNTVQS
jgi:hypothetical protein